MPHFTYVAVDEKTGKEIKGKIEAASEAAAAAELRKDGLFATKIKEGAGKKKKDYVTSIRFCDGGFVFKDEKGCDTDLCVLAGDQRASSPVYIFDVIGNVYEHPERANASSQC